MAFSQIANKYLNYIRIPIFCCIRIPMTDIGVSGCYLLSCESGCVHPVIELKLDWLLSVHYCCYFWVLFELWLTHFQAMARTINADIQFLYEPVESIWERGSYLLHFFSTRRLLLGSHIRWNRACCFIWSVIWWKQSDRGSRWRSELEPNSANGESHHKLRRLLL